MIKQGITVCVFAFAVMVTSSAYSSELSAFQNIETSKVSVEDSNNVSGQGYASTMRAWEKWFKTNPQAAMAALRRGFADMSKGLTQAGISR